MPFNPNKPYRTLGKFRMNKPFEKIGFDPNRPYEVVNELLKQLKIKTVKKNIVSPPKKMIHGNFIEPPVPEKKVIAEDEILKLIRGEISLIPKTKPQKIIEKVIEKEIIKEVKKEEKKEEYAEKKKVKELEKEIEDLKSLVERIRNVLPTLGANGGSGVIGIPSPEGQAGKTLSSDGVKAIWSTSESGSSSGIDPIYIGDQETDGSWRFTIVGTTLSHQRRESGVWVEKGADLA